MTDATTTEKESSSWVKGVDVITLFVTDLAETKRFYQDVFALPIVFEGDTSCVFGFGNMLINVLIETQGPELIEPAPIGTSDAGPRFMFTIQVDDVDATMADLKTRGVEFLNGPIDRPWGVRTAAFKDPGGHAWEIAH